VYKYKIPSGAKSKIVRVPRFFFKSPRKIIANFVRGVIDGDGSVSKNCISLSSGSYLFLKDIIRLVSIFGIRFRDIKKNDSQKYLTFDIRLYGKENAANFYSLLYEDANFFYPRKKRVWEGLKNKIS
jgi:intein/homing endonuclease